MVSREVEGNIDDDSEVVEEILEENWNFFPHKQIRRSTQCLQLQVIHMYRMVNLYMGLHKTSN